MDGRFHEKKIMKKRHHTKMVREGEYIAEVDIEIIDTDDGWSPYLSLDDAQKLDDVRDALRYGDLLRASKIARIFSISPVKV